MLFESFFNFDAKFIGLAFGFNFSFFEKSELRLFVDLALSESNKLLSCFFEDDGSSKLNFWRFAKKVFIEKF